MRIGASVRRPDGTVVERVDLRWAATPSAGEVLREIAGRRLAAKQRGLQWHLDEAPDEVIALLAVTGLS